MDFAKQIQEALRLDIRDKMAEAWAEGAETAWQLTGEGNNAEYLYGHGTHNGEVTFEKAFPDLNPYLNNTE